MELSHIGKGPKLKEKRRSSKPHRPRGDTVVPLYPETNTDIEREKNSTLERLLNAFTDMVIICDLDMNRPISCNKKVSQTLGFKSDMLEEMSLSSIFSPSTLQKISSGNTVLKNQEMECASGLKLPVDIYIEQLDWNGKKSLMVRIKDLQDDRELRQVVGGVVHDLNNVFSVLCGNATLLEETLDENGHLEIASIIEATNRGVSLVRQLQQLTVDQIHRPQTARILPLVEKIVASLSYWQSRYNIYFHIDCIHDYECYIDMERITEAIFNIIKNAKDAMPNGGKIRIRIQDEPFGPHTDKHTKNPNGLYLSIEDEGIGIPEEHRNRIFSPTFSTKRLEKKGYGFGLANVLSVIKAHGGNISVESKTGESSFTRFIIFIPK